MSDIPNKDQQDLESIVTEAMAEESTEQTTEKDSKSVIKAFFSSKFKIPRIIFLSLVGGGSFIYFRLPDLCFY